MDGKLIFLAACIGILILAWIGAGVLWRAAEVSEIVAPIDPQTWEELTVVTVGTGNAYENPERHGPSTAVALGETVVLVDAGRGIAEGLRSARIPLDQPDLLVLTNLLPVNTMGLDDLLLTGWLVPREAPLRVLGPPGTRELVESLERAHAAGRDALGEALGLPESGGRIEVLEIPEIHREEIAGLTIEARSLPGGPLPTLAWRFSDGARRVVVSGSGWGAETLASFAGGADVLVHEAAYLPTVAELEGTGAEVPNPERIELEAKLHTSILDVGDIARGCPGRPPRARAASPPALLRAPDPLPGRQRLRGRDPRPRRRRRPSSPDRAATRRLATFAQLAGSLTSVGLAHALMRTFTGKGLVPDQVVGDPVFLVAVGAGASAAVLLATRLGLPISTTHVSTGSLLGIGLWNESTDWGGRGACSGRMDRHVASGRPARRGPRPACSRDSPLPPRPFDAQSRIAGASGSKSGSSGNASGPSSGGELPGGGGRSRGSRSPVKRRRCSMK